MSLTVGDDYQQASQNPFPGKIFYDSGELRYEGTCVKLSSGELCTFGNGTKYYKDGTKKEQGLFQLLIPTDFVHVLTELPVSRLLNILSRTF